MKSLKIIISIVALAIVFTACNKAAQEQAEEKAPKIDLLNNPRISIGKAKLEELSEIVQCTGVLEAEPSEEISVHARLKGYIQSIKYQEGEFVQKGAVLFVTENQEIIGLQRDFLTQKSAFNLAEKALERASSLHQKNGISDKEFQEAQNQYNQAKSLYLGYKSELELAGVDASKLSQTYEYQKYLYIRASAAGYISNIQVNQGAFILPEQKLANITTNKPLHLVLKIFEKNAANIRLQQEVKFSVMSQGKSFTAKIFSINPSVENGILLAHCHIATNPNLKPGMYVNASIQAENQRVYVLAKDAVITENEETTAYMIENNEPKPVKLSNVVMHNQWVSADEFKDTSRQWIVGGAYYLASSEE